MNVIGIKSLNIDVIQFSRQLQKSESKIRTMKTGAVIDRYKIKYIVI